MPAHTAIEHVLEVYLGIKRVKMTTAVTELQEFAATMENRDRLQLALTKAYGANDDEESYSGVFTRLLGVVWPYMKRLPEPTRKSWLDLAIAESFGAYEGRYGGLSCSKGIQERLTVTGFLNTLEDVDPRLIAISTLSQNVAVSDVTSMIEGGIAHMSTEMRREIGDTEDPDAKTIERWIRASIRGYAENIAGFQGSAISASHMTPAEDFLSHSAVEHRVQESGIALYTDPEYAAFGEWKMRVINALPSAALDADIADESSLDR